MNISVILSGGSGLRFGSGLPKQYHEINGKEVISYVIDALSKSKLTDNVIVACGKEHMARLTERYGVVCAEGGSTRNITVKNSLDYISAAYADCKNVFFCDSARPFLTSETTDAFFEYLNDGYDAAITTARITDSLGRDGVRFTNRDEYYLIQTPEAFRFKTICRHFKAESETTAIVQQLPANSIIMKHFGLPQNMKITHPQDLSIAGRLLKEGNT